MSAGGTEYTLYFAWVPQGAAWDVSLARFDEEVFDLVIEHDEGQIPTAAIEIKNPRIGFISPTRLYWAWIAFSHEACPPQPLFYGRLVGIPEAMLQNTIKIKLIARAMDYVYQKQQVARSLKVLPNYDRIFFELAKRDDPDAILEGWSALYHVDRVNGRVSASDILVGEDGTVNFAAQDIFYDSVQYKIQQSPLVAVNVKAEVQWEQQYRGSIYPGTWAWPTLGGEAFIGDWPKTGASLGGGWHGGVSWAGERDPSIEAEALANLKPQVVSSSYQWTNLEKTHNTGDTMSISISQTPTWGTAIELRRKSNSGVLDPYAVDENGDPDPINIPPHFEADYFCYRAFALDFLGKQAVATLGLIYEANRKRSEKLEMTVQADVQPVLIDPLVTEDTEQITLKSGDLSLPLIDLENWDSVAYGGRVELGQFIFPDNPLVPGQTSSQICVQAGNTGSVIPNFSNIAGRITADNTVIWASLGSTQPSESAQDWVRLGRVPLGTLLLPKPISGAPNFEATKIPGALNYPPTGTAVAAYSIYCAGEGGPGDTMYECTESGLLGGTQSGAIPPDQLPPFAPGQARPPAIPPGLPVASQAVFETFRNPTGAFMYIAIQAGIGGDFRTTFNETPGSQTVDGSIVWQNIGRVNLPIGGWPGMTPAAAYFPTDRGRQSVEHMLCRARAKLRKRARAVEVSFNTRFEVAAQLSCRMNGVVTDARLPGGSAFGKIIAYKLEAHGNTGELIGSVTLGCSIGNTTLGAFRTPPVTDPGIPSYVQEGYVKRGWQKYYSSVSGAPPGTPPSQGVAPVVPPVPPHWPITPPTLPPPTCPPLNSVWTAGPTDITGNDIGYTPPVYEPNDDGLIFPASPGDLILKNAWHGIASTLNPINIALYNLQLQQIIYDAIAQANTTKSVSVPGLSESFTYQVSPFYDIQVAVETAVYQKMLQGTGLWYELVLKPVANGPFDSAYVISVSQLSIPKTIDLSASSEGGMYATRS